ncbi:MAG: VanZ family protein [bacterium]|nr:VanZ family protein [bacterium]
MDQIKIYRILFLGWLFGVLFLSLLPNDSLHFRGVNEFDSRGYFQHALAYGTGTLLICFAHLFDKKWKSVGLVMFWGILLETIQLWLPYRSFNVFDIVANLSGIMLFYLGWLLLSSIQK